VEVIVPPAVLGNAVSATVEGPGVQVLTVLVVLDVDGDELLDPARAEVLLAKGVNLSMNRVVLDDVDANALVLTAVADDDVLLLEAVDAEVEVLASPAVLEHVAFALGETPNELSFPVKLGAGLASLAPIGISMHCGGVVVPVKSATIEVQVSTEVKSDSAWSDTGHGTGEEYTASPLRVIIYTPPYQKRDYGLRSGNAELISNTCIAEGEIVAVFGETAIIWSQDDVREFKRVAVKQNDTESDVQTSST